LNNLNKERSGNNWTDWVKFCSVVGKCQVKVYRKNNFLKELSGKVASGSTDVQHC